MNTDMDYVRSKMGKVKMIEILFTCIVFACITVAKNGFEDDFHQKHDSGYRALRTFNIIGFLAAIIIFLAFWIQAHDLLGCSSLVLKITNLVFCVVMFFGCLVTGISMVGETKHEHESDLYKTHQGKWRWYTNHTITAVAFDFFAAAAFLIDGIMQVQEPGREAKRGENKTTVGEEVVAFVKN